jgi:methanogenic corrinoid protein MtbC1
VIRWCAGCQKYLGEVPPRDDFRATHTVCPACRDAYSADDDRYIERWRWMEPYYRRLRAQAISGDLEDIAGIIAEGTSLGIRPFDLMIGMVQPILQEIGELWAKGEIAVETEHRFSSLANAMLALIYANYSELRRFRQHPAPQYVLVNAEDNYHVLGLQLVELSLCARGIPSYAVVPGLPARETLALVTRFKPRVLGMSVALAIHMKSVRETLSLLAGIAESRRPEVIVGGNAVRDGMTVHGEFGVRTVRSVAELESESDDRGAEGAAS